MRVFFALPLSSSAEHYLAETASSLQHSFDDRFNNSLRWIKPANYHITLAFLAKVQARDVERLHAIAQQVLQSERWEDDKSTWSGTLTIQLSEVAWFPSPLKPKLIVAIPESHQLLELLQKRLCSALREEGFHIEKRPFKAHVSH
jgi:2'-5' RNA ligase